MWIIIITRTNMVLFRITESEPSKMHNVRPYVYSRPWSLQFCPSAARGLRTIKGIVLDIFPWNLHTLCNLLFPMSRQSFFKRKLNFGSGLHLRIAENLDSGISNPKLWTQWFFETSHCHSIEYSPNTVWNLSWKR